MNWSELCSRLLPGEGKIRFPKLAIPALPDVVFKVAQKAQEPDVAVSDLGGLIETDAALTSEMLRYVNSSAMMLRHKASNASRASALLGVKKTKLFVLTVASNRLMNSVKSPLIVMRRFSVSSMERALFAKAVASHKNLDSDLAFSGGLLQDLVLPTLTAELSENYSGFVAAAERTGVDLAVLEQNQFGWDHALAAGLIMKGWGFPDDLISCVVMHHRLEEILADPELAKTELFPVAMAGLLHDLLGQSPNGCTRLQNCWSEHMTDIPLEDIAEIVSQQLDELVSERHGHVTLSEQLSMAV